MTNKRSEMSNQVICSCGCTTRGLSLFEIHGYKENNETHIAQIYDHKLKRVVKKEVLQHHNGQEHVIGVEVAYYDYKTQRDIAIKECIEQIEVYKTKEWAKDINEWSIWSDVKQEWVEKC